LLHGEDGDDALNGGAGNDLLYGHFGNDAISGGAGDDTAHGGQGDDTLTGNAGGDALHGNDGNDRLTGGAGSDTLFGGDGDDLIVGNEETDAAGNGAEQDFLNGGAGDDTILTGAGDIVTSGTGHDTVVLGDWMLGGASATVMDYSAAEDQLVMVWDDPDGADPEVQVTTDADDPGLQHVVINGETVASVHGAGGLSADDILLVDSETAGTLGLQVA
jgi:Ca2+-binding RTX toxin-like protein